MRVQLSAEAAAELEAATAWYDNQRPGLGLVFIDAVDAAIRVVAEWPESGSPIPTIAGRLGVRRVPVRGFPYHLPYLGLDDHVRVLAVAHDRRRPRYWATPAVE